MADNQLKGLAAIVKGKTSQALVDVRRQYNVDAAVDQAQVQFGDPNVVLTMLVDHARDELVMRVKADIQMMLTPEMAAAAQEGDRLAALAAREKRELAKLESDRAQAEFNIRQEERKAKEVQSEAYLARELDARYLKKQQELDRKIANADKAIAAANTEALARVKAEVGVVRVVSVWLRSFTNLLADAAEKRASLLELSDDPIAPRQPPPLLLTRPIVPVVAPAERSDLLEME